MNMIGTLSLVRFLLSRSMTFFSSTKLVATISGSPTLMPSIGIRYSLPPGNTWQIKIRIEHRGHEQSAYLGMIYKILTNTASMTSIVKYHTGRTHSQLVYSVL